MNLQFRRADQGEWPFFDEVLGRWSKRDALDPGMFAALGDELKGQAFTSARLAGVRAIDAARQSLAIALEDGLTVGDWKAKYWDDIAGRFGKPGASSPGYVDMLFRTSTQNAYAGGRYAEMFRPDWAEAAPFWQYNAISDARTRPQHRALDGKVFRKDDPYSRRYLPPLGFSCRCTTIELNQEDIDSAGWTVSDGAKLFGDVGPPPKGWDSDRVASLVSPSMQARFLGPPVPAVTEQVIRGYEAEIRAIKTHEEGILFDQYGLVEWRGRSPKGDPFVLPLPKDVDAEGKIFTHNHPGGRPLTVWKKGGGGDLSAALGLKLSEVRACRGVDVDIVKITQPPPAFDLGLVAFPELTLFDAASRLPKDMPPELRFALVNSLLETYLESVCRALNLSYQKG